MANGNFGGGTGSKTDPYLVEDAEDLKNCVKQNTYYKQVANIDLSAYTDGSGWPPIRIEHAPSGNHAYYYDGNGKKVLNMYQNTPTSYHNGLFRLALNAHYTSVTYNCTYYLDNIVIVNANVIGLSAGILCSGNCNAQSLEGRGKTCVNTINVTNCFVSGNITSIIDKNHALLADKINVGMIGTIYDTNANPSEYLAMCVFRMKNTVAVMQIKLINYLPGNYSFSLMSPLHMTRMGEYTITDCAIHAEIDAFKYDITKPLIIHGFDVADNPSTTIYNSYVNVAINKKEGDQGIFFKYFTGNTSYRSNLIANHERGQSTFVSYDSRHYLTNIQMKDLSYYKALGWTVYEP